MAAFTQKVVWWCYKWC